MKVSIIGAGNMARGIGTRVLAGGNDLELVARNREAAQTLASELGGGTVSDSAGDDAEAKEKVASFVEAGGLRPLDVGPLRRARQLEQLGFLHITAQEPLGAGFASAVKLHW